MSIKMSVPIKKIFNRKMQLNLQAYHLFQHFVLLIQLLVLLLTIKYTLFQVKYSWNLHVNKKTLILKIYWIISLCVSICSIHSERTKRYIRLLVWNMLIKIYNIRRENGQFKFACTLISARPTSIGIYTFQIPFT